MSRIEIVFDKFLLDRGIEFFHKIELSKSASWLVFGASGSGKSVLVKSIIGRIGLHVPDAQITICDGKADDYTFLRNIPNARYFEYLNMRNGLTQFFDMFNARLIGKDKSRSFRLIVLEEWSSYLRIMEGTDKESAKAAKLSLSQLFSITSQGRSFNVHALISLQRPDAAFLSGFRENLTTVIGLGRISPEAARMVNFNEYPEFSNESAGQGVGWMLTDAQLFRIQVPQVNNFTKLHNIICEVVTK